MTQTIEHDLQSDWPTTPAGQPPERPSRLRFMRELPFLLLLALGVALLLKTFLVQAFFIPSESMLPTLVGCDGCTGDRVLVNKLAYRFREPRRGEIIVFIATKNLEPRSLVEKVTDFLVEGMGVRPPRGEKDYIKRVIGLPGDTIQVTNKGVFITPLGGKRFKLNEPYIKDLTAQGPPQSKFKVPEDRYFVMGDNRTNSSDSRAIGTIAREDIIGKAFVIIFPIGRAGLLEVPEYTTTPKATKPTQAKQASAPADGVTAVPVGGLPPLVPIAAAVVWTGVRTVRRKRA